MNNADSARIHRGRRSGSGPGWKSMPRTILMVALMALSVAACGRATAALERGVALEQEGEPLRAALSYIEALERDSSLDEAAQRLADLAPLLADLWEKDAAQAVGTGAALEMAEQTLLLTDVLNRSAGVDVPVPAPRDWRQARRDVLDRGIEAALEQSAAEVGKGDWGGALRFLDRAMDRYEPAPEQSRRLRDRHLDHRLAWAESEIRGNSHRSGYNRLEEVRRELPAQDPRLGEVERLQEDALRQGLIQVAFLPVEATDQVNESPPRGFAGRLDQELQIDHWLQASPFIGTQRASDVRRETDRAQANLLRSGGGSTDLLTLAAEVGRVLSADRAVALEVEELTRDTTRVRLTERTSPVRGRGTPATGPVRGAGSGEWQERTGQIRMRARISFFVVDPATRRRVDFGSVTATSTASLADAVYDGDWEQLDLATRERVLFTRTDQVAREMDAEASLLEQAAERVSGQVVDRLLNRIP